MLFRSLEWNKLLCGEVWSAKVWKNRLHEKFLIADGQLLVMGGMNIGDDYLAEGRLSWHDDALILRGPAAVQAQSYYDKIWELGSIAHRRGRAFPRTIDKRHEIFQEAFYGRDLMEDPLEMKYRTPGYSGLDKYRWMVPHIQQAAEIGRAHV